MALDEVQHDVGERPSLAAMTTNEAVVVEAEDARNEKRWPRYFSSSALTNFGSMLSVPLDLRPEKVGALNFYA